MSGIGVTTTLKAGEEALRTAHRLAERYGWPYVPRRDRPLTGDHRLKGADIWVKVGETGAELVAADGSALVFHPGLAVVRIKRLLAGGSDPLVQVAGLGPGDSFLDCTLGLAHDAAVASFVTGPEGRVRGLEAVPEVAALVEAGLQSYRYPEPAIEEALRRIEVRCVSHAEHLAQLQSGSWEVVYFDPMFRRPVAAANGLAGLRSWALPEPLSRGALDEAWRVARRRVVVKERAGSGEFSRLGLRVVWRGRRVALGLYDGPEQGGAPLA